MGLIFTTIGWTGASIEFEHAAGTDTFELDGDEQNPYDVAQNLRDWLLDDPERPWSAAQIATVTITVGTDGKRHRFTFAFTGSAPTFVSITPSAEWTTCFGDTSSTPTGTARATLGKDLANVNWLQRDTERGGATREGGWRMLHQQFAFRRPRVEDRLSALEVFVLSECQQYASPARTAYLYDRGTWRLVVVGEIQVSDVEDDPTRFDVLVDVLASPGLDVIAPDARGEVA